jgi:hypothetical protein
MSQSPPPANKKWYEDDDLTVTENITKEAQRQSEFGPGVIGTEFNAIKVKLQETYEIGILKLFIETEILRSASNEFEPGLKQLYEPERMTKPFNVGKELLFTSDVEFSEAGFLPGSLQNDHRKYFLNFIEFNKYLLRLPKPISDIETPVEEKADSNAYKYLQILGDEKSNRILTICNDFKRHNDEEEKKNSNAIIKLQKELDDAKKLVVDASMTQVKKMKLQEDIDRKLTNEKNKKIKLETRYKNYKAACKILSNVVRRMQYDDTLVKSFPVTIKNGKSLSSTIVEWLKYKQNNPNFLSEVLSIFKPILSKKAQKEKEIISQKIEEVVSNLSLIFKPLIESYFYDNLRNNLGISAGANRDDINFLNGVIVSVNRTNDPVTYSWKNINSVLKRISELTFVNVRDKDTAEKLYFISDFMVNFQSDILRIFTFNKKDGGIVKMIEEITASDTFLNTGSIINMLYHNIVYLKVMLAKIIQAIDTATRPVVDRLNAALAGLVPRLNPEQQFEFFVQKLNALRQLVDSLETLVSVFRLTVENNSYKTILGEASHATFVESIFSEKYTPISNANRNNKFLVVSDFITDAHENSPVTITIPDDYYDLDTLSGAIEKELCDKCKWKVYVNVNANPIVRDTTWSCKYDENKKMQLKLYFPENDLINVNNIIPNIHDAYRPNFFSEGVPAVYIPSNNIFQLRGGYIRGRVLLTIPQGEYRDIQHLLYVMETTMNDFIGKKSFQVTTAYKSKIVITQDSTAGNRVKFDFKSDMRFMGNWASERLILSFIDQNLAGILGIRPGILNYEFFSRPNVALGQLSEHIMSNNPAFPAASKSVQIKTRMQIDGDEYDASAIFGIPSSVASAGAGVITITPNITIREFAVKNNKIKVNEMLDNYLGFLRITPFLRVRLERISDYGFLNFTTNDGFRITVGTGAEQLAVRTQFDAVDLNKIVSKENGNDNNRAKLKTEILEKTGLYINNSLLKAKVPVITSTDILNSLFYRYPCIPSSVLVEGTPEFDKFIEERVNVSKFKEVVWLGKGKNDLSEPLSLTIRKALDKTLMYDDCDEERSKLMCDLHYVICGPVFTNPVLKKQNQYGEINELEMFHQFQLEIKRPDILQPRFVGPLGRRKINPFTVKGITPYYDAENKRYKYLIFGHYFDTSNNIQVGCVKYYDPGDKIGPQDKALQLYDILLFTLHAGGIKLPTVNSVVEVNYNSYSESFIYPVFSIAGVFDRIRQYDDFGIPMFDNDFHQINNVVWTPGKNTPGLPFYFRNGIYGNPIPRRVEMEINRINADPLYKSNSFETFWNVRVIGGRYPPSRNIVELAEPFVFNISDNDVVTSILNVYSKNCPKCIIRKMMNDNYNISVPYLNSMGVRVENIIIEAPKITCGAVSINKDVFNTTKEIHFYQREYLVEVSSIGSTESERLIAIQTKINELHDELNKGSTALMTANPSISNNMLWIGLKKHFANPGGIERRILSCVIINPSNVGRMTIPLVLPVTFEADDSIEKIKVDINDPEIVTVFGRFTATIQDINGGKGVKTIRNAMVIYTNLRNVYNNNENYGDTTLAQPYSLQYDNFRPITINSLPEFKGYSCVDGLIVALNHGGTTQQNMGTLSVIKSEGTSPVVIGFHNEKITEITIDEQYNDAGSDIWSSILCYDYNMCANIIRYEWDAMTNQGKGVIDKGLFNPLSFNAFKTTLDETRKQRITELFNGEFVLVESKQFRPMTNASSNLHVLNTWGIDLRDESTPFYKRIDEGDGVNMKIYEMYINKVVDTIIGSAKKYYEDKIKNSLYNQEYGIITSSPPDIKFRRRGADNIVTTGGGRREDAAAMIVAKQVELEEIKNLQVLKKNDEVRKIESIIEIRVPDIMMSDTYLAALLTGDDKEDKVRKDTARKYFFDALWKYSKKVKEIAIQENKNNLKTNREKGNVVIEDKYKVVLCCASNLKEFFDDIYNKKAEETQTASASVLTLSTDLNDYDLNNVADGVKNVIIVNEWNDRGFIGDYGAFACADSSSLTSNQMIISKTVKANPREVNQDVEYIPKTANSSFLLNPFITYGSFDSSRWTGIDWLEDKNAVVFKGGGSRENELRMMQDRIIRQQQQQQQLKNMGYGLPYDFPYNLPYNLPYDFRYNDPYRRMSENDYEGIMHRQVVEKTNASSSKLREDRTRMMRPDGQVKRVVLWLCDFREGKMLMDKISIGTTNVILSLPSQKQIAGFNQSGYSLLQELCRKYFQTEAVLTKWTLEHTYIYSSTGTGIFIYNAKASELPKEQSNMVYVSMKAIYNIATEESKSDGKISISIFSSDKPIIAEIFKVVKLITGGIISSTSKEFNDIVARLVSKTVPPHLRSIISVAKRKNNIEANVNFLIKLFFSPNNLFFSRGNVPYYIYSSQRNCKIYTMMKQPGYDDDSYLTCLKLFLQTETDLKNKGKLSNFRVGCAVKKKLITDNFSAVWDNFWGDIIESEEVRKLDDQLQEDVGEGEEGMEGEEKGKKENEKSKGDEDDAVTSSVCLELASQNGERMYSLPYNWKVSNYWPMKYNQVYYNIRENEKYRFNNEFFYDLDRNQLTMHRRHLDNDSYLGFKCIAYYKNGNNPILFLGSMGNQALPAAQPGVVYKLELNTHKLTKFIQTNNDSSVLCMDILDDVEGQDDYMLVGGKFNQITTYKYDADSANGVVHVDERIDTIIPAVMINLKTYKVIKLYPVNPLGVAAPTVVGRNTQVQKVCICKTKKIVKAKGGLVTEDIEGYIALIGGVFEITVTNDNNPVPNNREAIRNIGCVLIYKNSSNPSNMEARLVAVDSKVALTAMNRSEINHTGGADMFMVCSIVCQENEDKFETVFFLGGRFNQYSAINYQVYDAAKAMAKATMTRVLRPDAVAPLPICNGIIKLTLKCEYDNDDTISKYNQASVIEPIDVNDRGGGRAYEVIFASLQYGIINSKEYLFCLTAFLNPHLFATFTRLNIFDIESKSIVIQTPNIVLGDRVSAPSSSQEYYQTLLLTKDDSEGDNIQDILIMSITKGSRPPYANRTFTCNISSLNKNIALAEAAIEVVAVESNKNDNIIKNNVIMDMFYIEDTSEVYIAHQNVSVNLNPNITEYPLTIRSNYQEIGEWNLKSESKTDEFDRLNDFIDKVIEIRKIFKFNPSMVLFIQNVDFRNYNNNDSKINKIMLETMKNKLIMDALSALNNASRNGVDRNVSGFAWFIERNVRIVNMDSACNEVDKKIKNIMDFVYAYETRNEDLINGLRAFATQEEIAVAIAEKMYNFVNDLLFMSVYTRCNELAELVCNNYVDLVITPPIARGGGGGGYTPLNRDTWRDRFRNVIDNDGSEIIKIKTFIEKIITKVKRYKKNPRTDTSYNFKICSDPETHTGVAYLVYNYNQNLNSLITSNNQENLKNKIYEYGEDKFFSDSSNEQFHAYKMIDEVNAIEQIEFCSFYKFDRRLLNRTDAFNDIGNEDSYTVYASVNISGDGINSGQVFEFLDVIREYFMTLRSSREVSVELGLSGPIKRIIFCGDFGCNLLNDVEVCKKFKSKQMKIYTKRENSNALNDNEGTNQIFMIDVDLVVAQVGGNNSGGYNNNNSNNNSNINNKKRICIGEWIEDKHRVLSNKRKTRRKVPLMLSSS